MWFSHPQPSPIPQVIKAQTTDPNVTLNADKVIRAAQVGTLPEREAVRLGGETSCYAKVGENLGKIWEGPWFSNLATEWFVTLSLIHEILEMVRGCLL